MVNNYTPERVSQEEEGIRFHYDLPVEFFRLVLGESFTYSSGYYRSGNESLDEAQNNKLALICKKLQLNENDHLLDIGVGWGNLAFYAIKNFGCRVTGISLSPVQKAYVEKKAQEMGIADKLNYVLHHAMTLDFPDGTFTKVCSLEATEHIYELGDFYKNLYRMTADNGIMAVQVITGRVPNEKEILPGVDEATDFMYKYIYPVGKWSLITESLSAVEQAGYEIVDLENMTDHYYLTQRQWYQNLQSAYPDRGASTGVTSDRYLAQLLFAAGSVDTFARSTNLDYQFVARKNGAGARRPLQLDRSTLLLDGPERNTLPSYKFEGKIELEVLGGLGMLGAADGGSKEAVWYVDMADLSQLHEGRAPDAICKVKIAQEDLMSVMMGQLNWPDAFVQDKVTYEGDLTALLWVRDILRSPFQQS